MKTRFFIIFVCGLIIVTPALIAQETPGIDNPAGIATVPQSSLRNGTVRNPTSDYYSNQFGGNLIVTGNVEGGAHFRGLVPYRSTWEFTESLGSSTLDSFLRDSARTYYPDLPPGVSRPYYLPSQTVTTLGQPGQSSLQLFYDQLEQQTRQIFKANIQSTMEEEPQGNLLKMYSRDRPMSMRLEELVELITVPAATPQDIAEVPTDTVENKISELASQLQQEVNGTSELQTNLQDQSVQPDKRDDTLKPLSQLLQDEQTQQPEEPVEKTEPEEEKQDELKKPEDIYTKIEQQIEQQIEQETQKLLEQLKPKADETQTEQPLQPYPATESTLKSEHRRKLLYEFFLKEKTAQSQDDSWQNAIAKKLFLKEPGKARATPGTYASFADLADAKFNQYMKVAAEYMKQGEYYRAADAWTLASTYKPDDPLAYAGKAYALFAAGEYMSSAYYLSRAIEIYPGYLQLQVKLEPDIMEKDALEKRVVDLSKWASSTGSGELFFLLAYICYRSDKLELAEEAIEITLDRMPDSAAVISLKNVIFKAIGRSL
jgi:tetratricopeptide (TPR) repeat protein